MTNKETLIVFARPLVLGQVKKRLAKEVGEQKALSVYGKLMDLTMSATEEAHADTIVYFSSPPIYSHDYVNNIQRDGDLGFRMSFAIGNEINHSNGRVCLIGSDCPKISGNIIDEAMEVLTSIDLVVGPAVDGGYYLIGMNKQYSELFESISWGENTVLQATLEVAKKLNLSVHLLPELEDVDSEANLPDGW